MEVATTDVAFVAQIWIVSGSNHIKFSMPQSNTWWIHVWEHRWNHMKELILYVDGCIGTLHIRPCLCRFSNCNPFVWMTGQRSCVKGAQTKETRSGLRYDMSNRLKVWRFDLVTSFDGKLSGSTQQGQAINVLRLVWAPVQSRGLNVKQAIPCHVSICQYVSCLEAWPLTQVRDFCLCLWSVRWGPSD